MSEIKLSWISLVLVVILGLGMRLYQLTYFPPSLNWDEVSLGYNAYSLLKTGQDEWGVKLPLILRAFGDYKLPVYVYLAVVSQALLGLTALATKLPSVLLGTGLIVVTYGLGTKLFSPRVGLVAAILVAVSPWTLFLSRVSLEANVGAFWVAAGMYYLLIHKSTRAILLLGISVWSYNSARIFVPLMLVAFWWFNRRKIQFSPLTILLSLVLFLPMIWQLVQPEGVARYHWLSILNEGGIAQINQLRGQTSLSPIFSRLVFNKGTFFAFSVAKNYVSYLSPQFLFFTGGSHYQFSIPGQGLLYPLTLPFFVVGLVYLVKKRSWILVWLLLAPLAGSITRDSPHTLRAIVMLPLPMLISAVGLVWLAQTWKALLVVTAFTILLALQLESYLLAAYSYRTDYSWAWQYGYQQVVQFIKPRFADYDQIVMTKRYGEPHEFVLYYWPWNPAAYQTDPQLNRYFRSDWYWVDGFSKFKFVNDWEMKDYVANLPVGKYLVVSSSDNEVAGQEVYRVNFLDNKPAFIVKEVL